jgi:hypothetical protein
VRGLVAELAERGLKVDCRTMWEFGNAEKGSYKKRQAGPPRCLPSAGAVAKYRDQTTTFMTALRHDRITAPCFIEGSINSEAFLLYIEKVWSRPAAPPHRHHAQSWLAQSQCRASRHPCRKRPHLLPPEIFAGSEADRAVLRLVQTLAPQRRTVSQRGRL